MKEEYSQLDVAIIATYLPSSSDISIKQQL